MRATHDCGMCDAPLRFNGMMDGVPTWRCTACNWWHISTDCCAEAKHKRPWTKFTLAIYALSALCAVWTACFMLVNGWFWVIPFCVYSAYCGGREAHRTWIEGTA